MSSLFTGVDILILAAGGATRFGGCKLLADWRGAPLISQALNAAHALLNCTPSDVASVNIVLGAHAVDIRSAVTPLYPDCHQHFCPDWSQGVGRSLSFGVAKLPMENSVLIMLADQPLINADDLRNLLDAAQRYPEKVICAQFDATLGVPALFPRGEKAKLLRLDGDQGAKKILLNSGDKILPVAVPNAALDIDTRDDLRHVENQPGRAFPSELS